MLGGGGRGQVCAPPNIQTSDRTLRSYILVRFQQSPSNVAVLLIYSGDDGLSLTCPPCFQKAEKQKKKRTVERSINRLRVISVFCDTHLNVEHRQRDHITITSDEKSPDIAFL